MLGAEVTPSYRSFVFSNAASTLAGFRPGTYLVIQNPANVNTSTGGLTTNGIVYLQLESAQTGGLLIDDVELGDDPRGDGTGNGAPAGDPNGGKNTGVSDECVSRHPDGVDTGSDPADFPARQACTYDAANL